MVATVFGLHPLASEAVAYVVQRQESLSALLAMAAVLLALRAEERSDVAGAAAYGAGTILFALGLGAKSTAVITPALFLGTALAFPGPGGRRWLRSFALAGPWLALAGAHVLGLLGMLVGNASAGFDMHHVRAAPYWLAQGRVLLAYLRLALWPAGQSVDHDFLLTESADVASISAFAAVAVWAATAVAVLFRSTRPNARLAAFGFLWFLLVLLPTSALPIRDVLVEHRVYLALLGLAFAATALANGAVDTGALGVSSHPWRTWGAVVVAATVVAGLGAATRARATLWGDVLQLWADAARNDPGKFRPRANYALLLHSRGDAAGAVREFEAAMRLDPGLAVSLRPFAANYSCALLDLGRVAEASEYLDRRLAWSPNDLDAVAARARAFMTEGRPGPAEALLNAYLAPDGAAARNGRAP